MALLGLSPSRSANLCETDWDILSALGIINITLLTVETVS